MNQLTCMNQRQLLSDLGIVTVVSLRQGGVQVTWEAELQLQFSSPPRQEPRSRDLFGGRTQLRSVDTSDTRRVQVTWEPPHSVWGWIAAITKQLEAVFELHLSLPVQGKSVGAQFMTKEVPCGQDATAAAAETFSGEEHNWVQGAAPWVQGPAPKTAYS